MIVFTDDQGYGDIGSYGATGWKTPHLDRLAGEGVRFDQVFRTWLYLGDIVGPQDDTQRYKELNRARAIQRSLFPSESIREKRVEIDGVCRSMQEVGGDYYDYFMLADGTMLFAIADVAGHGYAAALRMSGIHYHLHRGGFDCSEPGRILTEINQNLAAAGQPNEFVTGFLACVSPDQTTLSYANAGHPGAILVRGNGDVETLTSTGLPLGVLSEATYEERRIDLHGQDLVVAFTDGLLEATNSMDEEFGESRVLSVVAKHSKGALAAMFDALFRSVAGFSGTTAQSDDIAIVAARIGHLSGNGKDRPADVEEGSSAPAGRGAPRR